MNSLSSTISSLASALSSRLRSKLYLVFFRDHPFSGFWFSWLDPDTVPSRLYATRERGVWRLHFGFLYAKSKRTNERHQLPFRAVHVSCKKEKLKILYL